MLNKDGRERFFEERSLLADIKSNVVLGILFLTISNIDINFQARNLQWRSYITGDILPSTKWVKLIGKKEFTVVAYDSKYEAFVVHIVALNIDSSNEMYPSKRVQIAHLKADEAPTEMPNKYADFIDVFLLKLAIELPEHTRINDHSIELVDDW